MTRFRRRLTFSNVTSALALFVVLGGGALAASTIGGGGKIAACYKTSGASKGLARLIASGTKCKHGEKAIAWNESGPAGAKGAAGATGAAGTSGTNGAKGDKGDTGNTGAPGSTILARMQGPQETLGSTLADNNITFTPSTWPQAAGEDQLILGTLTVTAISGCPDGAHVLAVTLDVDGIPIITSTASTTGTRAFQAYPVSNLSPVAAGSHTLTATATNTCTGSASFTASVDIVSFK